MTRMTRPARPVPFSVRLTPEDRQRLEREAGRASLGGYIRSKLLDSAPPPERRQIKRPDVNHKALAAVLAKLAKSNIANNLNQLTKLAHSGSLVLTPEIEADIRQMKDDMAFMRELLVTGVGRRDGAS